MKRVVVFLVIIGLTTMCTFGQRVENRSVSGFSGIEASCSFDITVVKGNAESLTLETNDNVMPYVRSEVKNGVLHLYLDKDVPQKIRNKNVIATVVMRDLEKVSLSGVCKITATDLFTPETFDGRIIGASSMAINVNTGQLKVSSSGAGNMQITANVTGDAKINATGSSKIELIGSAKNLDIGLAGSSLFKAENFIVETASVKTTGSSTVTVNASDALDVNSTGASTVRYKGTPATSIKSSGPSKVRSI